MDPPGASLTMSVPNIITSPSGGRFDFDDGGYYCGGWQDNKAHGHGVCTGPKCMGVFSGSYNFGFEMSGVYKWPNGLVYEGRWQNGKRHGVGVEYNGKWIYKGEWSRNFKGRYGVKASSNSAVKYEGTWANGLQDGYGSETYSDGGYYQGQMCRGLRHGYGVRKSAPYGDSQLNNPNKNGGQTVSGSGLASSMLLHSSSLQSSGSVDFTGDDSPKPEDGFKPNIDRTMASKNGFVLVAKPLDVPMQTTSLSSNQNSSPKQSKLLLNNSILSDNSSSKSSRRRNSLTNKLASARIPGTNSTASILRGLRLRKQKSTSDLDALGNSKAAGKAAAQPPPDELPAVPFTLSPEELDITDPTTVETYTGEWRHDKRNGHGVCERSDGLRYEGQWHNDMKSGYGQTTFKNGTKEEGKYKNNILIADSRVKRLFQFGSANVRQRIDDAVKMAHQAQAMALKKAEIADNRAATARDKADQATTAAVEADRDSQIAFSVARQYNDSQQQLSMGLQQLGMGAGSLDPLAQGGLNMSANPLQLRRVSQQQQQQQMRFGTSHTNFTSQQDAASSQLQHQQDQQQYQSSQQQQQYLGPSEPFNGRRGSFRAGSQPPSFAPRPNSRALNQPAGGQLAGRQSTDPFNDLFDHYRAPAGQAAGAQFAASRARRAPARQASLDYNQVMRPANQRQSPMSQAGDSSADSTGASRLRNFRMSSMDHAEEHGQLQQSAAANSASPFGSRPASAEPSGMSAQQQQLRHLVTSGEELQAERQPSSEHTMSPLEQPTPTGSSYILPHSTNSSLTFNQTQQQPSPSPDASSPHHYGHSQPAGGGYSQQQQQQFSLASRVMNSRHQRDVHSLADEQLYISTGRRADLMDRSDFANYDFAISSAPRIAQRCVRRTASLSRHSSPAAQRAASLVQSRAGSTLLNASQQRTPSPAFSASLPASQNQPPRDQFHVSVTAPDESPVAGNHQPPTGANSISSHLTLDSASGSSGGPLFRKPSLQVRYDPVELGGLMSREEVAALSHAQREQKRLEQELAERRAKRPILHLYLSFGEFLGNQKLILTVLVVNLCLFKLFADLIS